MQMGTCIFICNYKYLSLYMYIYIFISILQVWKGLADQDQADQHHHTWAYSLACSSPDEWQVQCLGLDSIFFLYWVGFGLKIDLDEQMHIFCTKTWENTSMPALRPWMSWGMVVL